MVGVPTVKVNTGMSLRRKSALACSNYSTVVDRPDILATAHFLSGRLVEEIPFFKSLIDGWMETYMYTFSSAKLS